MIRPFGLRDLLRIRNLQRTGIWLDLFHHLLLRRSALSTALIAPVPWVGTGLASFVLDVGGDAQGFIQLLRRPGRQEADVLFLAPEIDRQLRRSDTWTRLLSFCVQDAGQHDMRRLFASLPAESVEIDAFTALGFSAYTNEDILALNRTPRRIDRSPHPGLRPRRAEDIWWLRRLYSIYTPAPVQHSEGLNNGEEPARLSLAWWELADQKGYVLDDSGEILGGVQIVSGRRGHWLLMYGDTGNPEQMAVLVRQGLRELAGKRHPVYCAARDYQSGLRSALRDAGFEQFARRTRLVKHLAVRVKAAEPVAVPGMAVERPH